MCCFAAPHNGELSRPINSPKNNVWMCSPFSPANFTCWEGPPFVNPFDGDESPAFFYQVTPVPIPDCECP